MNEADRLIAQQKATRATERLVEAAQQLGVSSKAATTAAAALSNALRKALLHLHEKN